MLEEEKRPARSKSVKLAQVGRRAQKLDRYEQVVELHQQGVKAADIASRVGIGERTVHRWLAHGSFPEARRRRRRPSLIDPYERYVFQWWQDGHRHGSQLYRELKAQGYKGSSKAMYNYLATLRAPRSNSSKSSPLNGPLEGHVNRLKLIKRSMYGRAKLPLLRQRVLRSSPKKRKSTMAQVA